MAQDAWWNVEERLRELISQAQTILDRRLRQRSVNQVVEKVIAEVAGSSWSTPMLVDVFSRYIESELAHIQRIERSSAALLVAYQGTSNEDEKRDILVRFLQSQGGSASDMRKDIQATKRWLDMEAMQERFQATISDRMDVITTAYSTMTYLLKEEEKNSSVASQISATSAHTRAIEHSQPDNRAPIRIAALQFLTQFLASAPPQERLSYVGVSFARYVSTLTRTREEKRWVRVAAMELSAALFPMDVYELLGDVLRDRGGKDGMVARANALRVLSTLPSDHSLTIADLANDDPSEHVRQEHMRMLANSRTMAGLSRLITRAKSETSIKVSAVAILELTACAKKWEPAREEVPSLINWALTQYKKATLIRACFAAIQALCDAKSQVITPSLFVDSLVSLGNEVNASADLIAGATGLLRWLQVQSDEQLLNLFELFRATLSALQEGESQLVVIAENTSSTAIETALAVAAQGDMTVSIKKLSPTRYRLFRGEPRGWRAWRLLNEATTPMPDKRKGYLHTHARVPAGEIQIAPVGMAEVTPTRVPGERQLYANLGGWGPFLPRVDDLLAVASLKKKNLKTISNFGVLSISSPQSLWTRLKARLTLSKNYVKYATARERSLLANEDSEKRKYADMVRSLGFDIVLGANQGEIGEAPYQVAPTMTQPYLPMAGMAIAPSWVESILEYSLSPARNSPIDAAFVAWVILAAVVLRNAWIMRDIEQARRSIPLTIGGWGTRGKSGSERLKAALFHSLRYDVVVKTTGCEAMFIHSLRDLPSVEIFIYRPYDKATIWEQRNVLNVAKRLRGQVFLWECMALQPRFVETLCNEWMKDEVTTLTNAYPDHEDIQGPGGEDVARVIGKFMPVHGTTFTTEEQMLPLLADAAKPKGTKFFAVPTLDAELLPSDLLARLPYQEHPRNVALILALAEYFGVSREYALVEIADYVIADLGVLKTYPTVQYRGRALTFSNGMSANERAGFMSNWARLAFDKDDPEINPETISVLVINNRADRVARSRVFAQIVVDDAPADHVILINTNLGGMMQFITEALDNKLPDMRITGDGGPERIVERFEEAMRWLKVPVSEKATRAKLVTMLTAIISDKSTVEKILESPELSQAFASTSENLPALIQTALTEHTTKENESLRNDIVKHTERLVKRISQMKELRKKISEALEKNDTSTIDPEFRRTYRELFLDRITILWDAGATGDQVIDFVTTQCPPGMNVRLMGAQNIKGTGLDFVYRWLSVDRVRSSLEKLKEEPSSRAEVLSWMGGYSDFGLIDCREALLTLKEIKTQNAAEWTPHKTLLDGVIDRLTNLEAEKQSRLVSSGKAAWWVRALNQVEALVDHLDSVRRSHFAATVMEDLYAKRVGHGRAALLLRDVTHRQKGGWLAKDLKKWLGKD